MIGGAHDSMELVEAFVFRHILGTLHLIILQTNGGCEFGVLIHVITALESCITINMTSLVFIIDCNLCCEK